MAKFRPELEESLVSWPAGSAAGAPWPEIEMLWSETLGKSTSNCSQKPLAGGAEK